MRKLILLFHSKNISMTHYLIMTKQELNLKSIMDKLIVWSIQESEAASLANKSIRQIRRIKKRYKEQWDSWLIHKARGRASNRKYDAKKYDEAFSIIEKYYSDYSYVMIHEKLKEKHWILIRMPTLRMECIRRKLRSVKKQKKPNTQRTMRPRKENYGEMEQYDGSYHLWFEDRWWESCLLVAIDDATWDTVLRFDINEGIRATFEFWIDYILIYGKPKDIYIDRFATYKINHPNATDDKELVTQFGRVCKELGIHLIFANSPQAKGRVERMNGTLQDRLVKELREANISTIPEANVFLKEIFLPKFNKQFRVEPKGSSNLHIPLRDDERERLWEIFSEQKTRKVQNDYTIRFETKIIQLYRDKQGGSLVYKWDMVTVEKRMDGTLHIGNKNWNYILSQVLTTNNLSRKTPSLPLPPVIWEDEKLIKEKYLEEKQKQDKEIQLQKQKEQIVRAEERHIQSKIRQEYHQKHGRRASPQKVSNPIYSPSPCRPSLAIVGTI